MANLFNTAAQKVSDFANLDKVQALESKYGAGSTGLPSDARHMAAMNQLSNAIAAPINKISRPLGTFVGDTGAFLAGAINELPGVYRSIKGEAPIKDVWEDIAANWKGSFGTPNITTSEEIYKDVYGIPSIDPTGKNLFTQYYEDDPYAGIEGQTAMLGIPQGLKLSAMLKGYLKNRLKYGAATTAANLALEAKAKAAEAAKAKAIATTKQYSGQGAQGGGGGSNIGGGQQTSKGIAGGAISHSAAKEARGDYEGWGLADGGLINFYRYGGFI